ncbi:MULTISPECIES: hypothetical protein [Actinosynnema]|uniref:hypothetical protein n=1 Tax=Actinosynnema TaxID=40566 RepID=UPI0020A5C7EE|nr:hypothetical protein [Actinosynnema pretiosum]MCP2094722.1 hypothetical protein [Actinosynnema pretiosum]
MTRDATTGTFQRRGQDVVKKLTDTHPAGARFLAATHALGAEGMNDYLDTLRTAGVPLPPGLTVLNAAPLTVRHRWVPGPVLLEHATTDPDGFVDAVTEIAGWVRALAGTDARLDTNLTNFCRLGNRLVAIDVLPPLVPSTSPEPENLFDSLFHALCFHTPVTLDALVGYAARALLTTPTPGSGPHPRLARCLPPVHDGIDVFPASWFRARAVLALRALDGRADPACAHRLFAATSARLFRTMPETSRAALVHRIAPTVEGLLGP